MTGRICPCGCGKLARPKDPGYGARLTIFGKSGYWRKRCIERLKRAEREQRRELARSAPTPTEE
jgi:hypothetical protein